MRELKGALGAFGQKFYKLYVVQLKWIYSLKDDKFVNTIKHKLCVWVTTVGDRAICFKSF